MNIRLLAIDIDGTLLNSQRQVSPGNREALKRVQEAGVVACLASGRLIPTLMPIAEAAGVKGPTITCNGAHVETAEGEVLMSATLSERAQAAVLAYSRENHVTANLYQPRRVLSTHESNMLELYRGRTGAQPLVMGWDRLAQEAPTKMIFIDHPEANERHARHFDPLQDELDFDLTVSEPEYLEFLPKNVHKGTAVQVLANHLGLKREEVAAIGDYYNDLEMVKWAGLGGAMGSGAQALKDAADVVVPGNDADGLAVFIERILAVNGSA